MIVSKCPLRISLAGGSSDLEEFIAANSYGAVISFAANLYVYATIFCDKNGFNESLKNYVVSYSQEEKCKDVKRIKNDVVREALKVIPVPPIKIAFQADVFSEGSGLAASSAYTIALTKGLNAFNGKRLSAFSTCAQALSIERKFNPLTGRQDPYGCGIGGLKKIEFFPTKNLVLPLDHSIFNYFSMYLVYTGVKRKSTGILKTLDFKKVEKLLSSVEDLRTAIRKKNVSNFLGLINKGWSDKKKTSPLVLKHKRLQRLDADLKKNKKILAHRLCGAGGGGYFLVFVDKKENLRDLLPEYQNPIIPIDVDLRGPSYTQL